MHASLQKLFNDIESRRESIVSSFRSLSSDQLAKAPRPGSWSAAEVLSHLLAAEKLSVAYMQKKYQGIHQASRSGFWEEIKLGVLLVSQRMPGLKFRAPKRVVENTPRLMSLDEIDKAWKAVREELQQLLEKIPSDRVDRIIYKHPAAGYLDVRQALVFLREHLIHHEPQLRKLRKH